MYQNHIDIAVIAALAYHPWRIYDHSTVRYTYAYIGLLYDLSMVYLCMICLAFIYLCLQSYNLHKIIRVMLFTILLASNAVYNLSLIGFETDTPAKPLCIDECPVFILKGHARISLCIPVQTKIKPRSKEIDHARHRAHAS